jgi:protein ImuB
VSIVVSARQNKPQERVACIVVPALALQLVLRAHPEWREDPVVVVEDDRPLAEILWANRAAREQRITRGLRFAQAKALAAKVHAEVVSEQALEAAIDELFALLTPFSPGIEPRLDQPGLFWVDPQGLRGLFGDHERWALRVHAALTGAGFIAAVVVGFARGPAWALGSSRQGALVVRDAIEEQRLAGRVPLTLLGLAPKLASELGLLGIERVGTLLALSAPQLRARYGAEVGRLHDYLSGRSWSPLVPRVPVPPLVLELEVQPPDDDSARLLFGQRTVLQRAAERLRAEQHAITALELRMTLERGGVRSVRVESAAPTLDVAQLVDLLRLRLAGCVLGGRVEYATTSVEHVRVHARQLGLAVEQSKPRRDLEAAARAIARLRASFGVRAVTRARLREAHLPEASFEFEPTREVSAPVPRALAAQLPLVRRMFSTPQALPAIPTHEPEAWLGQHGAVRQMFGPHRIAGGWWSPRGARERDYHFVETNHGSLLWMYYDRAKRRWFMHGAIE